MSQGTNPNPGPREINEFLLAHIDSIPQLEALLLVWNTKPKAWTVAELAPRLYIPGDVASFVLADLVRKGLLVAFTGDPESFRYASESEQQDRLIAAVEETYRRELVRITNLIHSKPSAAVREFARAFRFKREKE